MLESFFKEYYDQISDFDPWIDARLNVLKDLKKELGVSQDLEDHILTAYRKVVLTK